MAKKAYDWEADRRKREKQEAARRVKEEKELVKFQPKFPTLDGFVGSWKTDASWDGKSKTWVLSNPGLKVEFIFRTGGAGTCKFEVTQGDKTWWSSFDRIGVSDSFYWKTWDARSKLCPDLGANMADLLTQVEKTREFHKTSLTVPGIGFSVSPERKAGFPAEFKKHQQVRFHPSGFGTGHCFSIKKFYSYAERATPAQEEFFGVSPLWHSTMDCD